MNELKELLAICNACEAGGPCWCCGTNERIREIQSSASKVNE